MNFLEISENISIVEYLRYLGMEPEETTGQFHRYRSPNRDDSHPSLTVYINKPVQDWYDFGANTGGDIGKLVQYLFNVNAGDALRILNEYAGKFPFSPCSLRLHNKINSLGNDTSIIEIEEIRDIHHWHLKNYLKERCIPFELASRYLKEAHYVIKNNGVILHSLAFKNDRGGYVLRHKGQSRPHNTKPQWITTINGKNRESELAVFEGFFDFLSFLAYYNQKEPPVTTVILNSVSNLGKLLHGIGIYNAIYLFLDNDQAGISAGDQVKSLHGNVTDYSKTVYPDHKDFNEMLISKS
jgi:hypothetical protein